MLNSNWPRWIKASCTSFFKERMKDLHFYVEGDPEHDTVGEQEWIEFRLNGPICAEYPNNCWFLYIHINVLVQYVMNKNDIYKSERLTGIAAAAFESCIPVFKFGDDPTVDDQTQLGQFQLYPKGAHGEIEISNFGKVETDISIMQVAIDANYRMILE